MRTLRAGVVGLGWAGQQHMAAYVASPHTELVAIAGMEDDVAARLAGELNVGQTYRSLDAMLAEAKLDVVSIATPTALHAPMAIQALEAGVHVLSEKPMAESAASAQAMVDAATRNDRVLDVCYNHRRHGTVQALRKAVDDGLLGDVYYARAGWLRRQGIPGLGTWFTRKDSAGGGPLMDLGVHMLDMALYLLDEPAAETVSASTYAMFGPRGLGGASVGRPGDGSGAFDVEDLATVFVRLDTGGTLLLEASWAQWVPHDRIYVDLYGSEGGAHLSWSPGSGHGEGVLEIYTDVRGTPAVVTPVLGRNGNHDQAVGDFLATVVSGKWSEARGTHSLHRMAIIDAAYASSEDHREVVLG